MVRKRNLDPTKCGFVLSRPKTVKRYTCSVCGGTAYSEDGIPENWIIWCSVKQYEDEGGVFLCPDRCKQVFEKKMREEYGEFFTV